MSWAKAYSHKENHVFLPKMMGLGWGSSQVRPNIITSPHALAFWERPLSLGITHHKAQRQTLELSINSPSLSPPISSAFTPHPLFQRYPQSKEFLLNLSMKCWNSAFNAQGSKVIIVVEHVEGVCVAVVQALRKKETQDETQSTRKISLGSNYLLL
jgi:hypothetical protein